MEDQVLAMLRGQLADIILGAVFLFIGLAACSIAASRRRSGVRLFIWLGIWSALYGAGLLAQSPAVVAALPHSIRMSVPYLNIVRSYLTVVVGLSAFLELSLGKVRLLIKILIFAGMAVALAGIVSFALGGSADKFIPYNNIVVVCSLLVLVTVIAVRKLSKQFLILRNRHVLAVGTLVFAIEALWVSDPDYPVCNLSINPGDRFLLYTDGVIEPENASGDSFGDRKLEQVVRTYQSRPPSELSDQLLSEIRIWQPASLDQQDDITLIVIDVV